MNWLHTREVCSQFFNPNSTDGDNNHELGTYQLSWGYYRGDRIGIFCYNDEGEGGFIDVDYLHYAMKAK